MEISQVNMHKHFLPGWLVCNGDDVFLEGNSLGGAIGQGQFVSSQNKGTPDDGNYVMELWYNYQATDNISITPAIYWLSRPLGDDTPHGNTLEFLAVSYKPPLNSNGSAYV